MEPRAPGVEGGWAHSFEEDEGDIRVYRPRGRFPFPPSRRGRETLDFSPSGGVTAGMPGPDDRTVQQPGAPRIEVVEAGPDILKVRFA
ncbi:hypothetical protein SAMN05216552_10855 [Pseudoduganella namucuonensis]|uniref:Uncharacterized protein n=2 Tax=Pseudoduganella namucuonensis TaxID=1035707 RepID=A0A1I7M7T1_9BURK|nr:hypothetical protein SAMN05216552_10855 [Pseudoduganella namucuonensis]